ncbi:hypothetical protein IVB22_39415 [Bradyrhizobium sp. 190]|uniref:hypothetical protein n=1 Tax=Bradyrhizobium sp. 190 TaxID=2782658 RepID=UPI001FFAF3AB|nr:hypothetical protein [Bradyrhizobium sp. 190]MCK1518437.1 hypothetical protein [Bradyrhizobium sp. 190]
MKEQPWHRRHAIQLAAQLPESREDALLILDAARRLRHDGEKIQDWAFFAFSPNSTTRRMASELLERPNVDAAAQSYQEEDCPFPGWR